MSKFCPNFNNPNFWILARIGLTLASVFCYAGYLDTLGISPLNIQKSGCESHLKEEIWLQIESNEEQNFVLDGTIHEVQCVSHCFGEFSLGVRNDYSCTFFSKCSQVCLFHKSLSSNFVSCFFSLRLTI